MAVVLSRQNHQCYLSGHIGAHAKNAAPRNFYQDIDPVERDNTISEGTSLAGVVTKRASVL